MTESDKDVEARVKAAEEQNKKAQEQAQKQVDEERERQLQAQRDAVGAPVSTAGMTFKEAAKATEEREQPPEIAPPEATTPVAPTTPTTGTPPPQTQIRRPAPPAHPDDEKK